MGKKTEVKPTHTRLMFTILGEPCSKANSRIMIFKNGKPRCIKNTNALNYVETFIKQAQSMKLPKFECDVVLYCQIYYSSYRKDLDESLIMDCLQKSGVISNDRQIKEKHIYHDIDKDCPRVIITLESKLQ